MSDAISDAMRGQFDDAQRRLAGDEFADVRGSTVVGRVRRRRTVTNTAVGAGTFVAVGAIAVAAMYLPRSSQGPGSSPGCSTWTPSPDPFPVTTISPDASDVGYDVTLPDSAGVMNLDPTADGSEALEVTLPDGSKFSVPRDDDGGYVFKVPQLNLVAVASIGFTGNLEVSVGGVDAVVSFAPGISAPRLVSTATPEPITNCGTITDASSVTSPFDCGFHMDPAYREDRALTITGAGFKSIPEAAAIAGFSDVTVTNPVVSNIDPLVPYVTAVNSEVPGVASGSDGDPAISEVNSSLGVLTGVAVVKVQNGVVVAVPYIANSTTLAAATGGTSLTKW